MSVMSVEQAWGVRQVDEWHLVTDTYDGVLEQDVRFDRHRLGRRIVSLEDGSRVDPGGGKNRCACRSRNGRPGSCGSCARMA